MSSKESDDRRKKVTRRGFIKWTSALAAVGAVDKRYSAIDLSICPDYVKLAEAYGLKGIRAKEPSEMLDVLNEALNHDGPVVADMIVPYDENVFPMVGPGCANKNMILGFEKKEEIPALSASAAINS